MCSPFIEKSMSKLIKLHNTIQIKVENIADNLKNNFAFTSSFVNTHLCHFSRHSQPDESRRPAEVAGRGGLDWRGCGPHAAAGHVPTGHGTDGTGIH